MRINIKLKKVSCLCMALVLLLLAFSGCSPKKEQKEQNIVDYTKVEQSFNDEISGTTDFKLVEENEFLGLYINGATAEVKIAYKKTGKEWFSNPQKRNEYDNIASGEGKDKLSSQINIEYNLNDSPQSYNSFTNAVENKQVSFEKIKNGIRVNYLFGDKPKQYFVPQALSVERYNQISKGLTAENKDVLATNYLLTSLKGKNSGEKAVLSSMYPILKKRDCYIVMVTSAIGDPNKIYASDYIMTMLHDAFASGGYTEKDYIKDNTDNLIKVAVKPDYTVNASIEYTLDEKDFAANIPNKSISFNDSYIKLMKISLLPMFGAAEDNKKGYLFVPDGSGALINLNNKKYSMPSFSKKLYAKDNTIASKTISAIETASMYMPVFGIKTEDKAFLAVIEKGDALADVTAEISGKTSRYNSAGVDFAVNSMSKPMATSLGLNIGLKYQKQITTSDLKIRYLLLFGDDANYSQMAKSYQTYLVNNNLITKVDIKDEMPLSITTIGAVNSKRSILGVPIDMPLPLTTYRQDLDILKELKGKGVENVILNLEAWSNAGVYNTNFNKLEIIGELGNKKQLIELNDYIVNNNSTLFYGTNFQYVGKKTLFNGFNENKYGARTLENVSAFSYLYELATKTRNINTKKNIVSPRFYDSLIKSFLKGFSKLNAKGIGLGSFGSDLNGDYNENYFMDRAAVKDTVSNEIKSLSKQGYKLSVNGGNFYSLVGTSFINEVPTKSGSEYIVDSYIPFYQMVLHGIIPYSSEPLNMSAEYDMDVLRLAETGTIPSFKWIYEENLVLKNTDYSYYSVCYKSWIDKAVLLYKELNSNLADCQSSTIIRHETISDGVRATTFSNHKTVYVNYNDFSVSVNGIKMNAKSYVVK